MATAIKDTQLDEELQELYIISSHWSSDVSFVQDEIRILKNALNKYHVSATNAPADETAHFYKVLYNEETNALTLKDKIGVFVKFIEMFIVDSKREMSVELLENFSDLGVQTQSLLSQLKIIKGAVYSFIEDAIRNGRYAQTEVRPKPKRVNVSKLIYML